MSDQVVQGHYLGNIHSEEPSDGGRRQQVTQLHYQAWIHLASPNQHQYSLTSGQQDRLQKFLEDFADLFDHNQLGRTSVAKHTIRTEGPPIRQPLGRVPLCSREVVQQRVSKMLENGVIWCSTSPWSLPIVLVRKRDGYRRFSIDFHWVNAVTHKNAYPLPRIDSALDSLSGSQFFSTLDLASGYWLVEVAEEDKEKTAFSSPQGHFEFNVMPFGLTNAPATFQCLMECTFAGLTPEECLIYIDDVIV